MKGTTTTDIEYLPSITSLVKSIKLDKAFILIYGIEALISISKKRIVKPIGAHL